MKRFYQSQRQYSDLSEQEDRQWYKWANERNWYWREENWGKKRQTAFGQRKKTLNLDDMRPVSKTWQPGSGVWQQRGFDFIILAFFGLDVNIRRDLTGATWEHLACMPGRAPDKSAG